MSVEVGESVEDEVRRVPLVGSLRLHTGVPKISSTRVDHLRLGI